VAISLSARRHPRSRARIRTAFASS
jgi:hypothetical protein